MFLTVPVEIANGRARFLGLYRVGDEFAGQVRARTAGSAIAVVLIVLVTTSVLIPVILRLEQRVVRFASDAVERNIDTLGMLGSAIAKRDSDTDAHNYRVTLMAIRLGEAVDQIWRSHVPPPCDTSVRHAAGMPFGNPLKN